jgi:hypothetical protein
MRLISWKRPCGNETCIVNAKSAIKLWVSPSKFAGCIVMFSYTCWNSLQPKNSYTLRVISDTGPITSTKRSYMWVSKTVRADSLTSRRSRVVGHSTPPPLNWSYKVGSWDRRYQVGPSPLESRMYSMYLCVLACLYVSIFRKSLTTYLHLNMPSVPLKGLIQPRWSAPGDRILWYPPPPATAQ